jgi:aminocarboxymuconate-semialdehyde decarboxylase
MIIDWHTHVHSPEEQAEPHYRGRCPATIDNVLRLHDEVGLDLSVISNSGHFLKKFARNEAVSFIRTSNEYLASLRDRHKDKIVALAVAIPAGEDEHLKELERAMRQDDLRGVLINSSHRGAYPDDAHARPFFQLATELDIPVFMHPPSVGFGEERLKEYRLASSVGRPMDNALAIARLIVRGIFEKFPTLKLVGTHLGGGICEMIGRMDYAYNLQDEAYFLGSYEPMLIKHPPSHYLKMMYLESTCYHPPAARCGCETVGPDHFIFGTDAPPLKVLKKQGVEVIKKIGLSPADESKVYYENAKRLLKI